MNEQKGPLMAVHGWPWRRDASNLKFSDKCKIKEGSVVYTPKWIKDAYRCPTCDHINSHQIKLARYQVFRPASGEFAGQLMWRYLDWSNVLGPALQCQSHAWKKVCRLIKKRRLPHVTHVNYWGTGPRHELSSDEVLQHPKVWKNYSIFSPKQYHLVPCKENVVSNVLMS